MIGTYDRFYTLYIWNQTPVVKIKMNLETTINKNLICQTSPLLWMEMVVEPWNKEVSKSFWSRMVLHL
jgi:hypothetical protein